MLASGSHVDLYFTLFKSKEKTIKRDVKNLKKKRKWRKNEKNNERKKEKKNTHINQTLHADVDMYIYLLYIILVKPIQNVIYVRASVCVYVQSLN